MTDSDGEVVLEYRAEGAVAHETGEYPDVSWKGLGEAINGPEIALEAKADSRDGLDMTPMVDVTFLLLIFFMVTASFAIQKSIAQPPVQAEGCGGDPVDECVTVTIDQGNAFYVMSPNEEEVECPSVREMWTRVKEAKNESNVDRMRICAHVDSMHKKVISAWDAGVVAGIENISIETTEEEL